MRWFMSAQLVLFGFVLMLVGCAAPAAPARSDQMVVSGSWQQCGPLGGCEPSAPAALRGRVTVADVTGSGEVNSRAPSKVSDGELREAVQRSLQLAGYLNSDPTTATVRLAVRLLVLDNSVGLDRPRLAVSSQIVTSRIRYV